MPFRALRCIATQSCTILARDCRRSGGGGRDCGALDPGAPCRRQPEKQRRRGQQEDPPWRPSRRLRSCSVNGAPATPAGLFSRRLTHQRNQRKIWGWPGLDRANQACESHCISSLGTVKPEGRNGSRVSDAKLCCVLQSMNKRTRLFPRNVAPEPPT